MKPSDSGIRSRLAWLLNAAEHVGASPRRVPPPPIIRLETIGRERSGKTVKKLCFYKGPLQGIQVSGLELTAADPRNMASWLRDSLESYRSLQRCVPTSTVSPAVTEYHLFEGNQPRVVLQLREVVGQVLTHTTSDSDPEQLQRFAQYVDNLTQADVIEVVLACPPAEGSPVDLERFEADLQLHASYLREAINLRATPLPCAVALILNKIDTRFASAKEARAALTDDRLRTALNRLVRISETSDKVGLAAIFPLTSFGFDNAVAAETAVPDRNGHGYAGASLLSAGETEWLLKPDATPSPYNLTGLVWWEIMAGLLLKPHDGREREFARLAEMLHVDLRSMAAWYIPLQCRGKSR
jgi:hypothetical protein